MERFEDIMLDLAWRRYNDVWGDKREIETKASILLSANGVLLGLVVNAWETLYLWLAVVSMMLVWLSATCCVVSLKTRKYEELGILESWEAFNKDFDDTEKLKLTLFSTLGLAESKNRPLVSNAAKLYSRANMLFLAAMLFVIMSFLANFLVKIF